MVSNLVVYNTTVQNIYLRGIYASTTGGTFDIHDNVVTNVQGESSSIAIFNYGGSGSIVHNTVSYANDAVAANHSRGTAFRNNIISYASSGLHTDNMNDGGGTPDVIDGNVVTHGAAGSYGIFVFVPYTNISVQNNSVTDTDIGLGVFGGGGGKVILTHNTVDYTAPRANSIGAYVSTTTWYWGEMNAAAEFSGTGLKREPDFERRLRHLHRTELDREQRDDDGFGGGRGVDQQHHGHRDRRRHGDAGQRHGDGRHDGAG